MIGLINFLNDNFIRFEENVALSKRTWIHRGGNASIYVMPYDKHELANVCKYLYVHELDFLLVGHTSNLYIRNSRNIDVVVTTKNCKNYKLDGCDLYCECGVSVPALSKQMNRSGICGFEYLTQLPGTIGGAICNNSSCKTSSISELLVDMELICPDGQVYTISKDNLHYSFRNSSLKDGTLKGIVLSAHLRGSKSTPEKLECIAKENEKDRKFRLEGHVQNLGCTVNRSNTLGSTPMWIKFLVLMSKVNQVLFHKSQLERKVWLKKWILKISGYSFLAPYISDKNMIVFVWRDDNADQYFNDYLEFMQKYYKTSSVEIQVIE